MTTLAPYLAFAERIEKARSALLDFIRKAKSEKKRVVALGASTKGNVVLQYCGITPDLIESVGEINPDKFGKLTPGTHVPILPEDGVLNGNPDFFIVLPWHFRKFFEQQQKYAGRSLVFPLPNLEILTLAPS